MFEVKRYIASDKQQWNDFVKGAKNGTFLFDRNYMDYHSDRFEDYSLMVYRKGALYALLPANISGERLYSHQGLTYGGLVMSKKACAAEILEVFGLINNQLKSEGIKSVIYKPTPYIYHSIPSQEDLYALFRLTDAKIIGRNISSTIYQDNKIKFVESRKSGIRKAKSRCLKVQKSDDFSHFWEILNENLMTNHNARPVHSLKEITLLADRFPDKIKLYLVESEESGILGGTVIYEANDRVIHTQYISASQKGKESGALDLLFDYLINEVYTNCPIFDFGQSTEEMGKVINDKLIFQKEGFGGRGVIYDIYEYHL